MSSHDLPIYNNLFEMDLPANPYPGLRPFQSDEWPIFFGREIMADEVINRLIKKKFVVVHGDSGCGKSSLIRAGVLPSLIQEHARGGGRWRTCTLLPGDGPIENLARALAELSSDNDPNVVNELIRLMALGEQAGQAIVEFLQIDSHDNICILVDQFEELFAFYDKTYSDDALLFVNILTGISKSRPTGLHVTLTMRSEFLGACARFGDLAEVVNDTQYLLPRMSRYSLTRAIREPAKLYNGLVSQELADKIIDETENAQDQLPLIQHGLMLMYHRKMDSENKKSSAEQGELQNWSLTVRDYEKTGGVVNLLSQHADKVAKEIDKYKKNGMVLLETIFRALTDIDADGNAIRRPQKLAELALVAGVNEDTIRSIIQPMREEGVSFLRPYGQEKIKSDETVDISHEALIRCWRKISDKSDGWLYKEFQDGLVWKSLLVRADDTKNVLSHAELVDRELLVNQHNAFWAKRYAGTKDPQGGWTAVTKLLNVSRAKIKLMQRLSVAGFVAFCLAGYLLISNFSQKEKINEIQQLNADLKFKTEELLNTIAKLEKTENERNKAELERNKAELERSKAELERNKTELENKELWSRLLAEKAQEISETGDAHYALSVVQPLFQNREDLPYVTEAQIAAYETLFQLVDYRKLAGVDESTKYVDFSNDGEKLVTVSIDNVIRITDVLSGHDVIEPLEVLSSVRSARLSYNAACVLTVSKNYQLQIWNAQTGQRIFNLDELPDSQGRLTWLSPDCRHLLLDDSTGVQLWNVNSTKLIRQLEKSDATDNERGINLVRFSDDGQFMLLINNDTPGQVFHTQNGELVAEFSKEQGGRVIDAQFSNDSKSIVMDDYTEAYIWDWQTTAPSTKLIGHNDWLTSVQFSNDNSRIVTTSYDATAQIWDVKTAQQLLVLLHDTEVRGAVFSPDDNYIATVSGDKSVRVWDAKTGEPLGPPIYNQNLVLEIGFTADSKQFLTRTSDEVRIWDINPVMGEKLSTLNQIEQQRDLTIKDRRPQKVQVSAKNYDFTVRPEYLTSQIVFADDSKSLVWTSNSLPDYVYYWQFDEKNTPEPLTLPGNRSIKSIGIKANEPLILNAKEQTQNSVEIVSLSNPRTHLDSVVGSVYSQLSQSDWIISPDGYWIVESTPLDPTFHNIYDSSGLVARLILPGNPDTKDVIWHLAFDAAQGVLIGTTVNGLGFEVDLLELAEDPDLNAEEQLLVNYLPDPLWTVELERIIAVDGKAVLGVSKADQSTIVLIDFHGDKEKITSVNLGDRDKEYKLSASLNSSAQRATLITDGDDVKLISFEEGGIIASLKSSGKLFTSATLSSDGRSVAAVTENGEAIIWPVFPDRIELSNFIDKYVKDQLSEEDILSLTGSESSNNQQDTSK